MHTIGVDGLSYKQEKGSLPGGGAGGQACSQGGTGRAECAWRWSGIRRGSGSKVFQAAKGAGSSPRR